jgi:hypothetical protein
MTRPTDRRTDAPLRTALSLGGLGALALVLACYRPPPRVGPLPGALEATTTAELGEAAAAARDALNAMGIPIDLYIPDSALVEGRWVDIAAWHIDANLMPAEQRMVRFRFLILPDSTRQVRHIFLEPLQPAANNPLGGRFGHRLAPRDHPAMATARDLLDRVVRELRD